MLEVGAGFTVIDNSYPQGYSSGGGGGAGAFGGSSGQGWTSGSGNHWTPVGSTPAETIGQVGQVMQEVTSTVGKAITGGLEGTVTLVGIIALLFLIFKK